MAIWLFVMSRGLVRRGLSHESSLGSSILSLVLGIIGARVLSGMTTLERLPSLSELAHVERGGFSFYGFFFGSCIALAVTSRVLRVRTFEVFDAAAPAMALTIACWRTGCFLNGCCWGIISDSRFDVPLETAASHPAIKLPLPLFESCFLILVFAVLHAMMKWRRLPHGCIAAFYLSSHAAYRIAADVWRPDQSNVSRCISVFLLLFGGIRLIRTDNRPTSHILRVGLSPARLE